MLIRFWFEISRMFLFCVLIILRLKKCVFYTCLQKLASNKLSSVAMVLNSKQMNSKYLQRNEISIVIHLVLFIFSTIVLWNAPSKPSNALWKRQWKLIKTHISLLLLSEVLHLMMHMLWVEILEWPCYIPTDTTKKKSTDYFDSDFFFNLSRVVRYEYTKK